LIAPHFSGQGDLKSNRQSLSRKEEFLTQRRNGAKKTRFSLRRCAVA
jgi:hypothetical protein